MTLIDYDVSGVWPPPVPRDRTAEPTDAQARYPLYTVNELGVFPHVEWLVPGYLAARELTVLWGQGATYKSFVALAWAAALGHPAVYIAAEGASGMQARLWAYMKHNGYTALPHLHVMPVNVNIHRPEEVARWTEAVTDTLGEQRPELVVADTLARNFVGGSENDPQDMGLFVDGVERMRAELDTAVLVIHHATKEGKAERGTESLRNASFASFKVTRAGGVSRAATLTCDRMKDAPEPAAVQVPLVQVNLPELDKGEAESSLVADWPRFPPKTVGGKDPKRRETRREFSRRETAVLKALLGGKRGGKPDALARSMKLGRRTLDRELKTLRESGLVGVEGTTRNRIYVLTEAGRAAL